MNPSQTFILLWLFGIAVDLIVAFIHREKITPRVLAAALISALGLLLIAMVVSRSFR